MKPTFLSLFLFICNITHGQYNETIRGSRPGNVIGAFTVGKGVLQFQQGVDYLQGESVRSYLSPEPNPRNGFKATHQLENIISYNTIRFGLSEKLELGAVLNYNWNNTYTDADSQADPLLRWDNSKETDFQNIDIGARYNILDGGNKAKLAWGIQARASFYQWIMEDIVSAPDLKIITAIGRNFSEYHSVRLNVGALIREFETTSLRYGVNYVFRPIPKFGITLEYSGEYHISSFDSYTHKYLAAIHYLICNDVQVDFRGGINDNFYFDLVPQTYYIGAGISWRVRTTKR